MHSYSITETAVDEDGMALDIAATSIASLYDHIERDESGVHVFFSRELVGAEVTAYDAMVSAHSESTYATKKYVLRLVQDAMSFGTNLIAEFGAENTMLGIEAYQMTRTVRLLTANVSSALSSGALLDGIQAMRDIDPADYDALFITAARLLEYINRCEVYMGMEKSSEV